MKTNKKDKWAGKAVKVDWKHIARGIEQEGESCPIALALREQGARDVNVELNAIEIGGKTYQMPAKAGRFVENFDADRTDAKPMEFKVGKLIEDDEIGDNLGYYYDW